MIDLSQNKDTQVDCEELNYEDHGQYGWVIPFLVFLVVLCLGCCICLSVGYFWDKLRKKKEELPESKSMVPMNALPPTQTNQMV